MIMFSHNLWLLGLSFLVSFAGCYAVLYLIDNINQTHINKLRLHISIIALILGTSMWAAHFISMLAMNFDAPVTYQAQMTLVSGLIAVALAGIAVYLVYLNNQTPHRLLIGGSLLALGLVLMHFIGMSAFRSNHYVMELQPIWIVPSVIFAVLVSTGALWLTLKKKVHSNSLVSASLLAIAICSVHHFSMLASHFVPSDQPETLSSPVIASHTLAIYVSLAVFALIVTALLTLVQPAPDISSTNTSTSPTQQEDTSEILIKHQFLPVERFDKTEFLNLYDILYVQADSHYSKVYCQHETYFCNLSITALEERLPNDRFLRVHRSFIANIMNIKSFKKDADKATLLFDRDEDHTIPVSRQRLKQVQNALGV